MKFDIRIVTNIHEAGRMNGKIHVQYKLDLSACTSISFVVYLVAPINNLINVWRFYTSSKRILLEKYMLLKYQS